MIGLISKELVRLQIKIKTMQKQLFAENQQISNSHSEVVLVGMPSGRVLSWLYEQFTSVSVQMHDEGQARNTGRMVNSRASILNTTIYFIIIKN